MIFANNPSIPAALAATKTFIVGCCASKDEPDDRNGLLRSNGHRPHHRATEKRDEIAGFTFDHLIGKSMRSARRARLVAAFGTN